MIVDILYTRVSTHTPVYQLYSQQAEKPQHSRTNKHSQGSDCPNATLQPTVPGLPGETVDSEAGAENTHDEPTFGSTRRQVPEQQTKTGNVCQRDTEDNWQSSPKRVPMAKAGTV